MRAHITVLNLSQNARLLRVNCAFSGDLPCYMGSHYPW